jgi:RNA polymerase sigma-70 factor (ECF subfamily)
MQAWRHERELQAWLASRLDDPALARDLLQTSSSRRLRMGTASARWPVPGLAVRGDPQRADRPLAPAAPPVALDDSLPEPSLTTGPSVDSLATCLPRVLAELSVADRDAITQCDLQGLARRPMPGSWASAWRAPTRACSGPAPPAAS